MTQISSLKNKLYRIFRTRLDVFPTFAFWITLLLYLNIIYAFAPTYTLGSSIWAEAGTNYFYNSYYSDLLPKFVSLDSGYWPLPLRLISYVMYLFKPPMSLLPFIQATAGLIGSALLVGVFCIKRFRKIIDDDFLRFLICLSILLGVDFQTRTFINFTYFSSFFIVVVCLLNILDLDSDVSLWYWFLPILVLSKPTTVSCLPILIASFVFGNLQFRKIAGVSILYALFQICILVNSRVEGAFLQRKTFTFIEKASTFFGSFKDFFYGHFFGDFGRLYSGISFSIIAISIFCVGILYLSRSRRLFWTAISCLIMITGPLAICIFALGDGYMSYDFRSFNLSRHLTMSYFGIFLSVGLIISTLTDFFRRLTGPSFNFRYFGVTLYLVWYFFSGWALISGLNLIEPKSTMLGNSSWALLSYKFARQDPHICIPIDPLGWVVGIDCRQLNPEVNWSQGLNYNLENFVQKEDYIIPSRFRYKHIESLALLVKPSHNTIVSILAVFELLNGKLLYMQGAQYLDMEGGLIHLDGRDFFAYDIKKVSFYSNKEVMLAIDSKIEAGAPLILWYGYDK